MHDIRRSRGPERGHGLFLREGWRGGGDGDFLSAGLVSGDNLHLGDAIQLGEGSRDVVLATSTDHPGHFSDVVDGGVTSQGRCAEEGK